LLLVGFSLDTLGWVRFRLRLSGVCGGGLCRNGDAELFGQ